jgi:hypothetical protein
MPPSERKGVCHDNDDVFVESRIGTAEIAVLLFDEEPMVDATPASREVESNDDSLIRQQFFAQIELAPRPQDVVRVSVLPGHVGPSLRPAPERSDNSRKIVAGRGQLVKRPVAIGLRLDGEDTGSLQLTETSRE